MEVGDLIKLCSSGAHFFGFVIELDQYQGGRVVTVWRPELPSSQQIQTWPLDSHYEIEVVSEGR